MSSAATRQMLAAVEQVFDKLGSQVTIECQRGALVARPTWTVHTRVADTLAVGQGSTLADALQDLRAADPELTTPQADRLMMIVSSGRNGESHPPREPVIEALERRGYIVARHCRANPRYRNFIATPRGVEIDERRRARLGSYGR